MYFSKKELKIDSDRIKALCWGEDSGLSLIKFEKFLTYSTSMFLLHYIIR